MLPYELLDLSKLPEESRVSCGFIGVQVLCCFGLGAGEARWTSRPKCGHPQAPAFGIWDVFFWRDAPDWYYKTFMSAGFMFSFSALRLYLDR